MGVGPNIYQNNLLNLLLATCPPHTADQDSFWYEPPCAHQASCRQSVTVDSMLLCMLTSPLCASCPRKPPPLTRILRPAWQTPLHSARGPRHASIPRQEVTSTLESKPSNRILIQAAPSGVHACPRQSLNDVRGCNRYQSLSASFAVKEF